MAMSFSRPDPSSPTAVSTASFATSRKGYEPGEVRDFLRMVAAELARLQEREKFLERELRTAQRGHTNPNLALDEEVVTRMLGEEAARILTTAREAASQIKIRAEENASRVLREATDEAQRVREEAEIEAARRRQDASADAEAELSMAKQQGRDMVNEARAYRERVLGELARRREMARQQIEQLVHGRDRLLQAFERARIAAVDVMAEMTPLGEPNEYVNLAPTTGPVPIMIPARDLRPPTPVESPEAPAVDEIIDDAHAEPYDVEDEPADDPSPELKFGESGEEGAIAPVVALFAGEFEPRHDVDDADDETSVPRGTVDDLFAKLRASRANTVVERTRAIDDAEETDDAVVVIDVIDVVAIDVIAIAGIDEPAAIDEVPLVDSTEELSVFQATPAAPLEQIEYDDTAFGRRDAELTPLIIASARKLKRILADEQNDVLHVLRSKKNVQTLADLLPVEVDHIARYARAIDDELLAAARAGAASMDSSGADHSKAIKHATALQPAIQALGTSIVLPLRERFERAVHDADGDNDELATMIRAIYREWKTQRIDEHLDDVARMAFGRGALAALTPGTPVCWVVDPNGPACPDAEDNALAGVVAAGEPFPTDHLCAPAHEGCRCMLQPAPR